jgi:omega-amidase
MHDLIVVAIQSEIIWEDIEANLRLFGDKIDSVTTLVDIIVLPEMFTTGYTMNTSLGETMNGKTVNWICKKAKEKNTCILGSAIIEENEKYFNRMLIAKPDGSLLTYDKRHLFTFAGEHNHFSAGTEQVQFELKGWKICPMICYDLRFPVWSRNTDETDLYIYVANWPEVRQKPWSSLLVARAIENVSYVIGVNRVGRDETHKNYSGNSAIIDFKGEEISKFTPNENEIQIHRLSKLDLASFRLKFPALEDKDEFEIKNS